MMQTARRPPGQFAHRLGRAAGRSVRWLQRREYQAIGWLIAEGLPAPVAAALLWIVKLIVLAGLLYRSEEHTSELQSLMRISYAVFCLKKKTKQIKLHTKHDN